MSHAKKKLWPRSIEIGAVRYTVQPSTDRGEFLVTRDGVHWAFVRRGEEGEWIGNTVEGWIEPQLVGRIMTEAR